MNSYRTRVSCLTVGVAAVALLVSGCGGSQPSASSSGSAGATEVAAVASLAEKLPESIRSRGYVSVAAEVYPTAVIANEGETDPKGWEPAIAEALGDALGIEFRFQVVPFDSIVPGLGAKRWDVAMGSIGITEDRLDVVDFVLDHWSASAFLTKAGSPAVKTALDLCGKRVAVVVGSTEQADVEKAQSQCTAAGKPSSTVQTFKSQPEVNLALENGRVDVNVAGDTTLAYVAKQNPGKFEVNAVEGEWTGARIPAGIAVARTEDGPQLAEALAAAVDHIIEDGTMQKIMDEWNEGKGAPTVDEAKVYATPADLKQ